MQFNTITQGFISVEKSKKTHNGMKHILSAHYQHQLGTQGEVMYTLCRFMTTNTSSKSSPHQTKNNSKQQQFSLHLCHLSIVKITLSMMYNDSYTSHGCYSA